MRAVLRSIPVNESTFSAEKCNKKIEEKNSSSKKNTLRTIIIVGVAVAVIASLAVYVYQRNLELEQRNLEI